MGKNITIDYESQKYILEFNRQAIVELEKDGISVDDIESLADGKSKKYVTITTKLIHRAFYMHHQNVSEDLAMKIFSAIPDKQKFLVGIIELFSEPIIALTNGEQGNVSWELNK